MLLLLLLLSLSLLLLSLLLLLLFQYIYIYKHYVIPNSMGILQTKMATRRIDSNMVDITIGIGLIQLDGEYQHID